MVSFYSPLGESSLSEERASQEVRRNRRILSAAFTTENSEDTDLFEFTPAHISKQCTVSFTLPLGESSLSRRGHRRRCLAIDVFCRRLSRRKTRKTRTCLNSLQHASRSNAPVSFYYPSGRVEPKRGEGIAGGALQSTYSVGGFHHRKLGRHGPV